MATSMLERALGEWPPDEREQYDETISSLEQGLTAEQLELARSKGSAMSRQEALAFASRQR
jgi:hypothetical protein